MPKYTYYLKDNGHSPLCRRLGLATTRDARLEYDRLGYRHIKRDVALRCLRDTDEPCVVTIDLQATAMRRQQIARALKNGKPIVKGGHPNPELVGDYARL